MASLACERRHISGCSFSPPKKGGEKRQQETSVIGGYGNPGIFRVENLQKNTGSIIRPKMLLVFAEAAAAFDIL